MYTRPLASTARAPVVKDGSQREVMVASVVVLLANCDVDDANSPVRYQVGVVVAFVVVPKTVVVSQGYAAAR